MTSTSAKDMRQIIGLMEAPGSIMEIEIPVKFTFDTDEMSQVGEHFIVMDQPAPRVVNTGDMKYVVFYVQSAELEPGGTSREYMVHGLPDKNNHLTDLTVEIKL